MSEVATTHPVTREYAERWADRARLDLEASADRGQAGMTKIRTAMAERHDVALGYVSLGAYLSDKYADALTQVCRVFGVDFRREVVKELTEAGLSTRAIAPVVGTSNYTVQKDREAGVRDLTPEPLVNTETGEVSDDYVTDQTDLDNPTEDETSGEVTPDAEARSGAPEPQRPVKTTGLDGKEYTRPAPSKPKRKPLTDAFRDATYDLTKVTERIERLSTDDRFPRNANEVAGRNLNYLVRARDLLSQVIEELNN